VIEDPRPGEVGPELLHLMRHALHLGMETVRTHGSPLVPFVLAESGGVRRVHVFRDESEPEGSLERSLAMMTERAPLMAFEAERLAVVYDGYLGDEDAVEQRDALFAEGIERGMGTSVTLAQRYQPGGRLRGIRAAGEAVLLEQGRHFIR
jgi:hypothetical protein